MPHLWALCFLVCVSVRPFIHPSVRLFLFRLKFLVEVVCPTNLKITTNVPYDMIFRILMPKLEISPHFHGQLNIENDSADGWSVYWGHILCFFFSFENVSLVFWNTVFKRLSTTLIHFVFHIASHSYKYSYSQKYKH